MRTSDSGIGSGTYLPSPKSTGAVIAAVSDTLEDVAVTVRENEPPNHGASITEPRYGNSPEGPIVLGYKHDATPPNLLGR